jgi:hypothetical protein
MRKYIRKMIRSKAEKKGAKASRYVRSTFNNLQIKKHGSKKRWINQAKGTHKRSTWRMRVSLALAR